MRAPHEESKAVITHHETGHAIAALMTAAGKPDGAMATRIVASSQTIPTLVPKRSSYKRKSPKQVRHGL